VWERINNQVWERVNNQVWERINNRNLARPPWGRGGWGMGDGG
jgi:hypothetical protein